MFVEAFMALMAIAIIVMAILIACRVIEFIWMCLFACFAPCICPNRHREPWPIELCNILLISIICIDNTLFKWCGEWCGNINRKLRRCKTKLKLCKIKAVKRANKIRIKPIVYDDVHIIVVNPYDNYQIATVSQVVNINEV